MIVQQINVVFQLFALSDEDELRREEWCIDADPEASMTLKSFDCEPDGHRLWTYTRVYSGPSPNYLSITVI